jgi:hypothetical protein
MDRGNDDETEGERDDVHVTSPCFLPYGDAAIQDASR